MCANISRTSSNVMEYRQHILTKAISGDMCSRVLLQVGQRNGIDAGRELLNGDTSVFNERFLCTLFKSFHIDISFDTFYEMSRIFNFVSITIEQFVLISI